MSKWRLITWAAAAVALTLTSALFWAFPLRVPTCPSGTVAIGGEGSVSDGVQEQNAPHEVNKSQLNRVRVVVPHYPAKAKKAGIQGTVVLEATIDRKGVIEKLELISGPPALVKSAEKTVRRWRYAPSPVLPARTLIAVQYTLAEPYPGGPTAVFGPEVSTALKPSSRLKLIDYASPTYPPLAKLARIQGNVLLGITVDKAGGVSDVHVISGPQFLVQAAADGVRQWKFAPPAKAPVEATVTVSFRLPPEARPPWGAEKSHEADSGEKSAGVVYNLGPGIRMPVVIFSPAPPYTLKARKAKRSGNVVLAVVVDPGGRVVSVKEVSKSLGKGLDESAIKTVWKWKFKPAERDGKPAAVRMLIKVTFHTS